MQDWERIGLPPVHPSGDEVITVLDWVLFGWHSLQFAYVNEAQTIPSVVIEIILDNPE